MTDFDAMDRDELFLYTEGLLKAKGVYSVTETWRETAVRIKNDDPELAEILIQAQTRWEELN